MDGEVIIILVIRIARSMAKSLLSLLLGQLGGWRSHYFLVIRIARWMAKAYGYVSRKKMAYKGAEVIFYTIFNTLFSLKIFFTLLEGHKVT